VKSDEFFGTLSSWANGIEQAIVTNEKRKAAAAKPPPVLAVKKTPASPREGEAPKQPPAAAAGEFDSIVKQLKNGSLYKDRLEGSQSKKKK